LTNAIYNDIIKESEVMYMKVILIVEGLRDAEQIHDAFDGNENIQTLVTGGTKFNKKTISQLENCMNQDGCSVYIFSDPDEAGEQISDMIQSVFPNIPRLEADQKECSYFTGKRFKMGIEYASYKYLRKLISPIIGIEYIEEENIDWG
jgi:5S rRNA maturation endonuclease (ribonuclease M5)